MRRSTMSLLTRPTNWLSIVWVEGTRLAGHAISFNIKGRRLWYVCSMQWIFRASEWTTTNSDDLLQLDAGMHPAKEGFSALPFFDEFDLSTVDILLISQYVGYTSPSPQNSFRRKDTACGCKRVCWVLVRGDNCCEIAQAVVSGGMLYPRYTSPMFLHVHQKGNNKLFRPCVMSPMLPVFFCISPGSSPGHGIRYTFKLQQEANRINIWYSTVSTLTTRLPFPTSSASPTSKDVFS